MESSLGDLSSRQVSVEIADESKDAASVATSQASGRVGFDLDPQVRTRSVSGASSTVFVAPPPGDTTPTPDGLPTSAAAESGLDGLPPSSPPTLHHNEGGGSSDGAIPPGPASPARSRRGSAPSLPAFDSKIGPSLEQFIHGSSPSACSCACMPRWVVGMDLMGWVLWVLWLVHSQARPLWHQRPCHGRRRLHHKQDQPHISSETPPSPGVQ